MLLCGQKIDPLVNVVALEQAVGGKDAAAGAMSARVGQEHSESVGQKKLSISSHADAIVAQAVQENDGVAVGRAWVDGPGAEDDPVGSSDGDVIEFGVQSPGGVAECGNFVFRKPAAGGVKDAFSEINTADGAKRKVKEKRENQAAGAARRKHCLTEDT